jgi:hypothetical protein
MFELKRILKKLDSFLFQDDYVYNLAIFRILFIGLVFTYTLFEIGNVNDFYGPDAVVSLATNKTRFGQLQLNLFHFLNDSYMVTYLIYGLTLISLFMSLVGYKTSLFLNLSFIGISSLQMRNVWILSSADVLVRSVFFILLFSPCYRVISVDAYINRKEGTPYAKKATQWTWRLIQIQVSVVYLWTCWHKLKGETWFDGSAVYYATRLDTMKNVTIPFLMDNKVILSFATWSTLLIEFGLGFFVWFKETRKWFILAGIGLHLGIEVLMAIPFFEWLMIVLLTSFFTPREYVAFIHQLNQKWKTISFRLKAYKNSWRDYEAV